MFSNKIAQYAKFIAAVISGVATAAVDTFGSIPDVWTFIVAAVGAVAVLMIPNASASNVTP